MSYSYFYFILIFVIGEIIINITFFNYLKKYFKVNQNSGEELSVKFLGLDISLFKQNKYSQVYTTFTQLYENYTQPYTILQNFSQFYKTIHNVTQLYKNKII
jgi:hypothetical protein